MKKDKMDQEVLHTIQVLEDTKLALAGNDSLKLKELSNQTIHSACGVQDPGSLAIAVLTYSLGKIIERKDGIKVKNWDKFQKKFISSVDLAIRALKENRTDKYESYIVMARKTLTTISGSLRHYIHDVLKKASINKASKLYEHGLSLGKTSNLLGLSQWELVEYTGETKIPDEEQNITMDVGRRAKMALEFFS